MTIFEYQKVDDNTIQVVAIPECGGRFFIADIFEPRAENPLIHFLKPIGVNAAFAVCDDVKNKKHLEAFQ